MTRAEMMTAKRIEHERRLALIALQARGVYERLSSPEIPVIAALTPSIAEMRRISARS